MHLCRWLRDIEWQNVGDNANDQFSSALGLDQPPTSRRWQAREGDRGLVESLRKLPGDSQAEMRELPAQQSRRYCARSAASAECCAGSESIHSGTRTAISDTRGDSILFVSAMQPQNPPLQETIAAICSAFGGDD